MSEIIRMENIHKFYKNGRDYLEALKGVSLTLHQGEMLAIMGSSGSGKSTLLNIIGAIDSADEGSIYLNKKLEEEYGKEPVATKIRSENIGFVFQSFELINDFTVGENVSLPLILAGMKGSVIRKKTKEMLSAVGLSDKEKNPVTKLSGGQKQRISIARALIKNPEILILDDSLSAVDAKTETTIIKNIQEERSGKTTMITTHRLSAVQHADWIIVLDDGKVIEEGTHEDLVLKGGWYKEQFERQQVEANTGVSA